MKLFKRFIVSFLTVSLYFMFMMILGKPVNVSAYSGIGEKRFTWEREIYQGVNLAHTMSYNQNRDQKTYTVDFNPKTASLKPLVTTGPNTVLYGNTMSSLIDHYEKEGQHVVFGFNGDGYDTSNSIPLGIGINDGKLLNSANPGRLGFGITANGEIKFGSTNLPMSFTINNGSTVKIDYVNKERKQDTSGVYFLTEDFYPTTDSTEAGVEVILNVDEGQDGLRIGQPYKVTVDRVVTVSNNPSKNKTPIGQKKAVLAAHTGSPHYNTLKNLSSGQKITVNVDDNTDSRINWSEVVAGMGIFHLLLDNGVEHNRVNENKDIHPRTVMGLREDGSVVLMQNDGRQIGWASGFSYKETVEYLRDEMDCVTVFNFDGGGSSNIAATLPGDEKASVLNRPSDGRQRNNANAILFIATETPVNGSPVEKLHIYPSVKENNANKGIILENGKMSFNVTATDRNYYPVALTGEVTFRVLNEIGNIGTITSNGVFTANSGSSKGKIIASYNGIETSFELEVTDSITSIERDVTIISIPPSATQNLEFRALKDGVPIIMSNESLTFKLEPSTLGSVSKAGVITATSGQGTGSLTVSYKSFSLNIPIEVGRMPHMILDFEEDIFSQGWNKYYTNIPNNGGSGNISINTDERYVKHGDGSLRIDYDFSTKPLTGTVAIEIGETGNTVVEGQPTAISSWVYGDGNGGWYRVQLTGGKYVGDVRINWQGWKYIETAIPADTEWPITLQYPVRLLGTSTIANNKKGTIYVDSVRAIYGFQNDDNNIPVIDNSSVYPANGAVTNNKQQVISLNATDADTGINTERTQMFINGDLVDNLQQTVNNDGSVTITYNPSALTALKAGKQNIKVRVEDNFGNKAFKEWSFTVTESSLNVSAELPNKTSIFANDEFTYKLKASNVSEFTNMELTLDYNKESLEVASIVVNDDLTIINETNDINNGQITLSISGMNQTGSDMLDLVDINFKAKKRVSGTTQIYIKNARASNANFEYDITLPNYDVNLNNHYKVEVDKTIFGSRSIITVTSQGSPVKGASVVIFVNEKEIILPDLTDNNGKIETSDLTNYPIGTELLIYAVKDDLYSDNYIISILGETGLVSMIDGASIRIKTEQSDQGLRFIGKLSKGLEKNVHGFYLVYGNTTISELTNALNNQEGDLIINGKKVFHIIVPGVNNNNEFSVVLTGIPKAGYLDNLSAIAYVVVDGVKNFTASPISRSVAEVALKMHNVNLGGNDILDILLSSNNDVRTFAKNAFGQYEVNQGFYEANHFNLKEVFIKDWNNKFKTSFEELIPNEFFGSAKEGLTDSIGTNKDLKASNIYKFFNDPVYKEKWGWFLEYMRPHGLGITHGARQIDAILGDGTNEDFNLYHADHLSYSIVNFFNQTNEVGGYTAVNFTQTERYDSVREFNDKIFVNSSDYIITKAGNQITIGDEYPVLEGYEFDCFMANSLEVMPGGVYTVGEPLKFIAKYSKINYEIKYFDGDTELTSLNRTYTIEDRVDLPIPTKDNHLFIGWYTTPTFTGSDIKTIITGTIGNQTLYAKFEEAQAGNYTINYELNGGSHFLGFTERDEMVTAFLTDFYNYLELSVSLIEFMHGPGQTSGFNGSYSNYVPQLRTMGNREVDPNGGFINLPEYRRWLYMGDLINDFVGIVNVSQAGQFWSSNSTATTRIKQFFMKTPTGQAGAGHEIFTRIPEQYQKIDLVIQFTANSPTIVLPEAVKKGYVFGGWYLNSDFSGSKVTEISSSTTNNVNLYAKWE